MSLKTFSTPQSKSIQLYQGRIAWSGMRKAIAPLALGLSLCLLLGEQAKAAFSFTKVADTRTSIPSGTGNFTNFNSPALDSGNVAFRGLGAGSQEGIYLNVGETLNVIADRTTPIPDGTGNFASFSSPSLDQENVTFVHNSFRAFAGGVSTYAGGSLQTLVQSNTPYSVAPNAGGGRGTYPFIRILSVSSDNGNIAFRANTSSPGAGEFRGLFTNINDSLRVVARSYDRGTCSNSGQSGSLDITPDSPVVNNGVVAFAAIYCTNTQEQDKRAILKTDGGPLQLVAEGFVTQIPGGNGNFVGFGSPALENGIIAFRGIGAAQEGIYTSSDQGLQVVADFNTPIPEGSDTFASFGDPAISDGNVAFIGSDLNGQAGIYTTLEGGLTKVVATGDVLDDKTISSLSIGNEAISGKQIAFLAEFTDGSRGIYVTTAVAKASEEGDQQSE